MLPIGTLLKQGEYRVVRYIASGGFGNTYEVEHVRLGKRLAVKEFFMRGINQREGTCVTVSVKDNRDTFDQMRDKFFKEAQRLARLEEPHIVEVIDFFDENQTAYYVMKLIEGESLSAAMKRIGRPFFEYEVRLILPQVLQALKRVHGQGIYHLDLKPGNIMLNAEGHCWLIDFGASKQLSAVESQTLSTSTGLCYTPGYAPSEQVNGNARRIGPWTDFYALGATLYNLLTNQAPPELDDVKYDGMSAFHFPSSVSTDMRQLVLWLMQPDYPKRPQAVEEIERRLGAKPTVKPVTVKKEASVPAGSVATVRCPSVETIKASHAIPINKSTGKKSNSVETVKAEKKKVKERAKTRNTNKWWWCAVIIPPIAILIGYLILVKSHNNENNSPARNIIPANLSNPDDETLSFTITGHGKTVTFNMKLVEAGTFLMGSESGDSDEMPVHTVTLTKDYYMGETEVTQALWYAVMGQSPTSNGYRWSSDYGIADNYPAYYICYEDCQQFLTKLNQMTGEQFRFPTEAEWEFAAKGGIKSKGYTYAGSNTIGDVALYIENSYDLGYPNTYYGTHAVKIKQPNELGLYDMSGSVWEWCYDWYGSYSASDQTDPIGPTTGSGRVARGGSWSEMATYCRCTIRSNDSPSSRYCSLGFRLAL